MKLTKGGGGMKLTIGDVTNAILAVCRRVPPAKAAAEIAGKIIDSIDKGGEIGRKQIEQAVDQASELSPEAKARVLNQLKAAGLVSILALCLVLAGCSTTMPGGPRTGAEAVVHVDRTKDSVRDYAIIGGKHDGEGAQEQVQPSVSSTNGVEVHPTEHP